jgi:hypothetical protein
MDRLPDIKVGQVWLKPNQFSRLIVCGQRNDYFYCWNTTVNQDGSYWDGQEWPSPAHEFSPWRAQFKYDAGHNCWAYGIGHAARLVTLLYEGLDITQFPEFEMRD